jgi:hypothetical protein
LRGFIPESMEIFRDKIHESLDNCNDYYRRVVAWQHALEREWGNLRFGEATSEKNGDLYIFEVQVYLSGLDPESVRVELYAEGLNGGDPVRKEMTCGPQLVARL